MTKVFDEAYYNETANRHGWGGESAVLDPERSQYLKDEMRGKSFLDVGCATGIYGDMLAKEGYEGYGVDFTPEFIEYAQKHHKGTFKVGDAYKLPYKDKSIDTVYMLDLLEHIDDQRALKEALRVAKKRVVIVVPTAVDRELEDSGLLYRDYLDISHLRYYTREMMEELAASVDQKYTTLRGVAPMGFEHLLRATISFPSRFVTKVFFKLFFTSLKAARVKTYYSEWLAVIDL
jgi:ubiquinone/menaquinone biosynthesis C-methylase UbiE